MPEVIAPATRAPREPRNGVNTPVLMATINAVKETPALAKFQFRATNRWVNGTYTESRVESFTGAGGEHTHQTSFGYGADHPAVLVGLDRGPLPVEYLLGALAACITAGIGNIAAARGVTLTSVESRVEGDIDLQGVLGLSNEVRNGYQGIRITFDIAGDAPPEKLRAIVEQGRARSAVFDVLTNGVPVEISVNTR
ncbi:MAG TPA: OsmC family protein [Vicinamibacterales bacterium]|jgi:uncharacterized OsmC-like protein|nr:OsmC family protein [Vicinamibacterales bacterium]